MAEHPIGSRVSDGAASDASLASQRGTSRFVIPAIVGLALIVAIAYHLAVP